MGEELQLSLDMIQGERRHNLADILKKENEKQERFLDQLVFLLNKNLKSDGRKQNRES